MAVNDLFKKVPVEVPNKSGFDESHSHGFSAKVGTLCPVMTDLLLPNDTVSLGVSAEVQLPPMATDFYGRVRACFEQFFVPLRLLYGGWQDLITQNSNIGFTTSLPGSKVSYLPYFDCPVNSMLPGSLSDFLEYGLSNPPSSSSNSAAPSTRINPPSSDATIRVSNPLRYLAYHKIWNDFYRDSRLQIPAFQKVYNSSLAYASQLPYVTFDGNSPTSFDPTLQDGVKLYELRQRCWSRDYFTNATPLPQAGEPAQVAFGIDNNQGSFSIQSLRAANSLQMWLERNNVAGFRYGDQIRAHFGIYPSDAALDRPLYLGRTQFDVYNKSVFQNNAGAGDSSNNQPFSSVGSKYGSPLGVGDGSLCGSFTASEHGYLMTIFSLVPDAVYSDTINRDFFYQHYSDFPFPLLQGIGDQPISMAELIGSKVTAQVSDDPQTLMESMKQITFGYTQRYSNHKFKLDRVSGLLKDNESLQSFALQRSFDWSSGAGPSLGSQFIEIPTTFLDQVSAVAGDVSKYGCWVESVFNYHKVSTLAAYSVPTLGEPKNTHTEVISNGGVRL